MRKSVNLPQKEDITKMISGCLQQYESIVAVYLFGSFITRSFFSDIDIGILVDGGQARSLVYEMGLERKIENKIKYPIDVRLLNSAPISFCQNVIRDGEVILDRNPNLRSEFEGRVLKEYFDFSRFRKRYLQEVINAPV